MVAPLSPAFLSRLHRPDQRWLTAQGTEHQVIASAVLLTAGQRAEAVYLVLEGKVDVLAGATDQRVATLGPGAVVGEMGFVQRAAASATVVARENTLLLRVPHAVLAARTSESPRFAAAFSRAVAAVIVDRLQKSTARLEGQLARQALAAQHAMRTDETTAMAPPSSTAVLSRKLQPSSSRVPDATATAPPSPPDRFPRTLT